MATTEICQILEWDSQFFGRIIGRVNEHRLNPHKMSELEAWCVDNAVECLYFLADIDHPETIRLAEARGFRLVDIRMTLRCTIEAWRGQSVGRQPQADRVRPVAPGDISALMAIARTSHTDSRFYFDGCFPLEACAALYAVWIRRSCEGNAEHVLVAELFGQPVGYCTCHVSGAEGQIGLIAISDQARGCGLGRELIGRAMQWFAEHHVKRVEVVTQGRNVTAQRLYQRLGFLTQSMQLWYHKWRVDCTP